MNTLLIDGIEKEGEFILDYCEQSGSFPRGDMWAFWVKEDKKVIFGGYWCDIPAMILESDTEPSVTSVAVWVDKHGGND